MTSILWARSLPGQGEQVIGPHPVRVGAQVLRTVRRSHDTHVSAVSAGVLDVGLAVLGLDPGNELSARVVPGLAVGRIDPPETYDVLVGVAALKAGQR
jgi:hypothetical protein